MQEMVPKYYLIKQEIIDMINREEIDENGMVPSERELMAMFGVSRITVRKAITDLVNEGYLYTVQGKGTFVRTDELNRDLVSIMSCTEDIRRMGMVPSKKVICAEVIPADKKRIKRLQLAEVITSSSCSGFTMPITSPSTTPLPICPANSFPALRSMILGRNRFIKCWNRNTT